MDTWQKLLIDEEERDLFFIGEEMREMESQQANDQQPYLGQRCHVEGQGFGTIVKLKYDHVLRKQIARVELDAQASNWYEVEKLELLPTYPAV